MTVDGIVTFRKDDGRYIRCEICQKYPHIIKQFVLKRLPRIVTANGTRFRTASLNEHLQTSYHIECLKENRLDGMGSGSDKVAALEISISKSNKSMVDYIGKLMIQVFVDAKRLHLSAFSWPSRYISGEASHAYDSLSQKESIIPNNISLRYVNPPGHLELMSTIFRSHHGEFLKKLNECIAISLRIDGSIDLTQIDKIYVMGKLINLDGSSELVFLGIGEQKKRFAAGLMLAVIDALKAIVVDPKLILRKVSSVCTDGTNVNTGEKNSLWVLLDKEIKEAGSKIPLIKIWCAAHRSELAWKNTATKVGAINKVLTTLTSISSYFHTSAVRTAELKEVASHNNLNLLSIPKLFEIRWSQFTFTLLRSILVSWKALIIYFGNNIQNSSCAGYHKYLTKLENVKLIAFLADILFCFKRFQKKLQSDRLTILSMKRHITAVMNSLHAMENEALCGGFESNLCIAISTEGDGRTFFKDIELLSSPLSRREKESFSEVRKQIIDSLREYLGQRFEADDKILKTIDPFVKFVKDTNIEEVHEMVAPDLTLANLYLQFQDISNSPDRFKDLSVNEIVVKLSKSAESRDNFKEIITVLSRIAACTPHSADVERCISLNNVLKSKQRSNLCIETENKYIYIHTNMPDLADWNPTAAAKMFVTDKSRRIQDITPGNEKTKQQLHFKGIFPEARRCYENDEKDTDELEENLVTKKKRTNIFDL